MGAKLIWLNFEEFYLGIKGKIYKGNLKQIVRIMRQYGIPMEDVEMALDELERKGGNVAEFGVMHYGFIFTKYKEEFDIRSKIVA